MNVIPAFCSFEEVQNEVNAVVRARHRFVVVKRVCEVIQDILLCGGIVEVLFAVLLCIASELAEEIGVDIGGQRRIVFVDKTVIYRLLSEVFLHRFLLPVLKKERESLLIVEHERRILGHGI